MPLLRQCLLDTYLVRLRAIARFWEVELTTSRQREAALELEEAMSRPETIVRAFKALSEEERQALQALLASDGRMPQRVFTREWGRIRAMGPGKMDREQPWEEPVSPAEGLWYHGFIFRTFEQGPEGAYGAVFVPSEIRAHLPPSESAPPHIALQAIPAPSAVFSAPDLLLDDACTLLAYVQNERPRLKSGRQWPKRHRQAVLPRLRAQDPDRFALLGHLAHSIGWVVDPGAGRLQLAPEPVTAWLEANTFHQRRILAEAWRDDEAWNDLFHVPSLEPEDTGAWQNDPVLARNAIIRHLKACTPETWYSLSDFAAAVKEVDPDFQRPHGDYETWYIRSKETGEYLSGFESWDAVEGKLIHYLITRPMTWLGLIGLGSDQEDGPPTAFRLTPGGAAILGLGAPPSPSDPPMPHLRSGFRVSVPAALRYERFQLARVADWLRSGDPFVYRLAPASLERGQKQGIPVARVIEFLDEITAGPVPRSVESALTRWDTRGTEAWLERSVLLRLSSEELMNRAIDSRRVGPLLQERVGPTAALVRERDWQDVAAALEEMGLLPQIERLERSGNQRK